MSPISPELGVVYIEGGATFTGQAAPQSASSSSAGSWRTSHDMTRYVDDTGRGVHWERESDDDSAVPKIEPVEDDNFLLDDIEQVPRTPASDTQPTSQDHAKVKRPRGRPRKHPLTPQLSANKIAKGRSKTGCITCRKRKKKCDEAKPRCLNCEKNAVVCEGYHEKTLWKSGREKAEEEHLKTQSLPRITLQPIFEGVETPEDKVFFSHYIAHLSGVLTVEGQHKNAFKDMLLQMALEHRGLMHSILSLASKHIDFDTPYGNKLLSPPSKVTYASLMERSEFHHTTAMDQLLAWKGTETGDSGSEEKARLAPRYGQMLCLLLQTAAEGNSTGAHRVHLQAYKSLIRETPPPDKAFVTFITEFFQYRVFADELIRYPDPQSTRLAREDWVPWVPIEPARLIGIGDGLFYYLTKITTIRNTIRDNINAGIDPVVDYGSLYRAAEIETAIRDWAPNWPSGDNRDRVSLLYKQMMWVYLFRTIYPPLNSSPAPRYPASRVDNMPLVANAGLHADIRDKTVTISGSATVPLSPASTQPCSSGHSPPSISLSVSDRRRSNGNMLHLCADPPPTPIRFPPHHDTRISLAVDESLAILESLKASDPVQTLLLVPCFVIGCASFAPSQQDRVLAAVRIVRGYTGLRNCDRVIELLQEIWRLMGRDEWMRVWDWQSVARDMQLDFACV
ncbi:hypothetical protein F5Y18DRAFT_420190 [Xylariaceae sp. FL1019]|nr:hypothetical protein F5Y18DRAFT_420190 [Xylariaceae sp. FL1019]